MHRLRTTTGSTLHQFELQLSPWIPSFRLAQRDDGAHSRDRLWNLRLVFWTFLWQITQVGSSCPEAIRQAQSLILHLLAFFSLATGLLTSWITGPWLRSEARLLQDLWEQLRSRDVLLADRGFSRWALLAECLRRQIHGVIRWHSWRRPDSRRGKRLSKNERLIRWFKPRTRAASSHAKTLRRQDTPR